MRGRVTGGAVVPWVRIAFCLAGLGWMASPLGLTAQAPPDSIAAWTDELRTGSLVEKLAAVEKLEAQDVSGLPGPTVDAVVAELAQMNNYLLYDIPIPGRRELRGEDFGAYYMALVSIAGASDSPEARRTMILSSGVSMGASRRAARLGDEAIPTLVEMIERDYQTMDAFDVMALAWFWADSTGAPLSAESRQTIFRQFATASESGDEDLHWGLASGLQYINDPTFLPLASRFSARRSEFPVTETIPFNILDNDALPALEERSRTLPLGRHFELAAKNSAVVCANDPPGPRRGLCESLENRFETARRHLANGRTGPARNVLASVADRLDQELEQGRITEAEHLLLAGGTRQVVGRLAAP